MSEPSRPRPVPGPPAGVVPRPPVLPPAAGDEPATTTPDPAAVARFDDLDQRPVAEHVDVFEAEHARLERELRTIDQL